MVTCVSYLFMMSLLYLTSLHVRLKLSLQSKVEFRNLQLTIQPFGLFFSSSEHFRLQKSPYVIQQYPGNVKTLFWKSLGLTLVTNALESATLHRVNHTGAKAVQDNVDDYTRLEQPRGFLQPPLEYLWEEREEGHHKLCGVKTLATTLHVPLYLSFVISHGLSMVMSKVLQKETSLESEMIQL